jgi:dihydrofolate reductase
VLATSLDAALSFARNDAIRRGVDEIMVIGGGDIFAATMPMADRLEITHVHVSPDGMHSSRRSTRRSGKRVAQEDRFAGPDDDANFTLATYVRR